VNTFLIPKDPLLRWSCVRPRLDREALPPPFSTSRTQQVFWGRNAIYHGLKALGVSADDTVLVPAYHCAAAVEPIIQYGARVTFYNILRDCAPDFEDVRTKITPTTKAVLVIHYFGFPQPIRAWQEFCRVHKLKLIEDCAHVLTGEVDGQVLGTFGDISVFSLRKFFPIYDGGQLIINNPSCSYAIATERVAFLFALKVAKNTLDKLTEDSPGWLTHALSGLVHLPSTLVRRALSAGERPSKTLSVSSYGVDFDRASLNMPISGLSSYLMRNSYSSRMVEQRRVNYLRLLALLRSFPGLIFPFPDLPKNGAPLVLPVEVAEVDDFHLMLREKGIPATTWGGVIHRRLSLEQFPDAQWLYKRLVCLPIHQDIRPDEIDLMAKVVGECLRASKDRPPHSHSEHVPSYGVSPLVRSHADDFQYP
jgi:perosamine synthetase